MEVVTKQHLGRYILHLRQGHTNRYLKIHEQDMDCANSPPITPSPNLCPFKTPHNLSGQHGLYLTYV